MIVDNLRKKLKLFTIYKQVHFGTLSLILKLIHTFHTNYYYY
ncbi:hypothetical protein D8827_09605 [Streptococcus intermedius]|uniref:Uncharacterized protein n=1 Tax=Streptococcus intermedius TaxID=1338 RepID=A0AAE8KB06_STRIT|nr:hypothetical protein D8833_09480 [Streptococcus intermedius]RSJ11792.1 hypothetical protein D8832_09715 [Streptococcus intermedius]RSJ15765.1 hypothetical protein D8831_08010 [Streptococcus intermedius]RSJ20606.1 hypothetical protein D8828_08685 [Streptococcus intermedius]RSJ22040.1 hypothetical protein D8827_09605 [Streptococcus intermedius]